MINRSHREKQERRFLCSLRSRSFFLLFLGGLLVLCIMVSMTLGKYPVSMEEVWTITKHLFFPGNGKIGESLLTAQTVLLDIRAPRLAAAVLIGAALSVSGASFQAMFVNPLVAPGILGVLPGASFGAALGLLIGDSWFEVQLFSFTGGLVAVLIAMFLAGMYKGDKLMVLILGGIISGSLFTSLLSVVKYTADPTDELPAIVYWLMGGLSMVNGKTVLFTAVPIVAGIIGILGMSRLLNVLSMGDEEARALGVNVKAVRAGLIFLTTVVSALTVAIGGLIGWVGLVIPHVGRMIVGPDNSILLPTVALVGGMYLLVADDISRLLLDVEIPLGIITSLVGIPFFSIIMKNARQGWK